MTDIRIPKLNNNDATYTLVEWLAEDDEPVKPGDDLATLETSKMFMQHEGAGSIYWLASTDAAGDPLDGGHRYTLSVPAPVPAAQFWSVTLYDLDTRSEINTEQFKPVLTSLRDHLEPGPDGDIALHFGPEQPDDPDVPWLQTNPGAQWFAYFRIYGPGKAAFDGTWKPSDFQPALDFRSPARRVSNRRCPRSRASCDDWAPPPLASPSHCGHPR